jgi:hypothetical protein
LKLIDRRALFGGAATLLLPATGVAQGVVGGADTAAATDLRRSPDPDSGESLALARHVALTRFEAIPAEALRMSRLSILDAIGVSMAASREEPACRPFLEQAFDEGAGGDAVVLPSTMKMRMIPRAHIPTRRRSRRPWHWPVRGLV